MIMLFFHEIKFTSSADLSIMQKMRSFTGSRRFNNFATKVIFPTYITSIIMQ